MSVSILLFLVFDRAFYIVFKYVSTSFYNSTIENSVNSNVGEIEKNFYDTLIIGSSRTKQGIHPWYLKNHLELNAYKNASAGQYLKYNYHFYKIYKKKYKIPEYLIYGFDYFVFNKKSSRLKMNILLGKRKSRKLKLTGDLNKSILNPFKYPSLLINNKNSISTFIIDLIDTLSKYH